MINYMDRLTLNLTAPRIKQALLLSNEQYGQIEGLFGLAFAMGALGFGWIVDRWNVRWVYAAALFAWSAAGFATGFAQTFATLLMCRFFLGLFEAGNWPCALRTTQRILPPNERTLGNSILQSGAAIGAIITPLLVQSFVAGAGAEWLSGLLPVDAGTTGRQCMAVFGFAPTGGFPASLSWPALSMGMDARTWSYPFFVIGIVGVLWVFFWIGSLRSQDLALRTSSEKSQASTEAHAQQPHESLAGIFCTPRFFVLLVIVIAINLTWHFFRVWLPLFLRENRQYSEAEVNYFVAAYYAATDAGSLSAGFGTLYLARRGMTVHGSRVLVYTFCSILTLLSFVVAFLPAGPLLKGLLLILGFGSLGLFPVYYSLSQELTVRHQGKVTGTLGCSTWLASAVMHPIVGRWIDQTKDYSSAVAVAGIFPLIGLAALLFFWGKNPRAALGADPTGF